MNIIPYAKQSISKNDIRSVIKVLKSDFITQGPKIVEFENLVKKYVNVNYAVAVNSATSALHIACLAIGLKKNDYLWTSPNSFVASANCGLYCGAKIDFVDIDLNTFNICIKKLETKLKKAKKQNKIPKILVLVHFAGNPCDLKKIFFLSKKYQFKIIEDASHALGSNYDKYRVGKSNYSDITVFSFHPIKIITTGEGGMAVTNNERYYKKLLSLKNHGIIKNIYSNHKNKKASWNYQQTDLGFNYRMNDISAALGISQIKKINKFIKIRNQIASYYLKNLKDLPIKFQIIKKSDKSAYHLFIIIVDNKLSKVSRDELYYKLKSKKINTNVHYIPIHTHPVYKKLGFKNRNFPNSLDYSKKSLSLPIYPGLKKIEINKIINEIKKIFKYKK